MSIAWVAFPLLSDVTSWVDNISISCSIKIVTSWVDIMIHEKVLPAVEEQPGFQLWSLPFSRTLEVPPGIRSTQLPPPKIFKDNPTQVLFMILHYEALTLRKLKQTISHLISHLFPEQPLVESTFPVRTKNL